jgi:hypothetical protein
MSRDTIPDDVAVVVRRAAAARPTQSWDLRVVRDAARRRGRRRLAGWLAGCLTVATGAAAVGVGVATRPAGDPVVLWAGAADADHLYVLTADCAEAGCRVRLLGSDDAGATWGERTDRVSGPAVLGPAVLYVRYHHPNAVRLIAREKSELVDIDDRQMPPAVSTDGGRTWSDIVPTQPWPAVPENAVFSCYRATTSFTCDPVAVDPVTRRMGALPAPPGLRVTDVRQARGQLWLTGVKEENGRVVAAAAVSWDDGRTWRVHDHPCACDQGQRVQPAADGHTAYWVPSVLVDRGAVAVYRSTDRGTTWQRVHVAEEPNVAAPAEVQSVVASDGALILVLIDGTGTVLSTWEVGPGDAGPRTAQLIGFPSSLRPSWLRASPLLGTPRTGYTAVPSDGGRIFRSPDGRHWSPVDVT